jgi:hypothetical protein
MVEPLTRQASGTKRTKGADMYIGGGFLALILVILLLIWIF